MGRGGGQVGHRPARMPPGQLSAHRVPIRWLRSTRYPAHQAHRHVPACVIPFPTIQKIGPSLAARSVARDDVIIRAPRGAGVGASSVLQGRRLSVLHGCGFFVAGRRRFSVLRRRGVSVPCRNGFLHGFRTDADSLFRTGTGFCVPQGAIFNFSLKAGSPD